MNASRGGATAMQALAGFGGNDSWMRAAVDHSLRRARALLEKADFAGAGRLYEGVLSMAPDHPEALALLGLVELRLDNAVRAESLIARSIARGVRTGWNICNHGAALVAAGRHGEALTVLDALLAQTSNDAAALAARADALQGLARFDDALAAYDRALAQAPGVAQTWTRRATTLLSLDRPADALISVERALKIDPNAAIAHLERARALRALGRLEEALRGYQLAMVVTGKTPAILHACGGALNALGRPQEALACFDEALVCAPRDEALLFASCASLDLLHAHAELLTRCDRLLELNRKHGGAWLGRGNALLGLGRHDEAVLAYDEALSISPNDVDAIRNRAAALRNGGRMEEALAGYDRALALSPDDPQLLFNRGVVLQQLGRFEEADRAYELAALVPAQSAEALHTQAVALQQRGEHEAALLRYAFARERFPNNGAVRRSEAFCRLLVGDFETGWRQHEDRWMAPDLHLRRRHADRPLWLGVEPLAGKTIMLHAEQGFGDTIQFCRYVPLVLARGASVVMEVPRPLVPLLASLEGVSRIVAEGDATPAFDVQCPLMSLPYAFRTTLETIPAEIPYLKADARRRESWARRLQEAAPTRRPRIGLAWSGNPRHNNDENRSLRFAALAPLLGLDATFVQLQPQVRQADEQAVRTSGIVSFRDTLADFADTAALTEHLDLIVSVDTSVAHLAGALGRPAWVLLPFAPDWRWLLEREDSPWYPSARLFRQQRSGDWATVIERVVAALQTEFGLARTR
ncbi:tetratricopeptide repeat protein [Trinickia diaoshuihuensis]|uniref:tetratricopeptide repeat protein n=1 Tax=Trinickia diaoshuihuensis TaxID=2292265 RepID=UPI001F0792DB|nr:tetratricopeptide repeat protein [Trinickia diaoshuihuensis]